MLSGATDDPFPRLDALIAECATGASSGSFKPLTGLPDGAVGFVATQETSDGPQTTERAYARVDDGRAAVVTVVHIGQDESPVGVRELLPTALERAAGA